MTSSERIEATFAVLEAAAVAGERCPMSSQYPGGSLNKDHVAALAAAGRIFIEISSRNWRRVTILTRPNKGKSTAPNPDPKASVYQTVGMEGHKINGKLVDHKTLKRPMPSAPRPLTREELFR
jgi:hypothetical protein